MGENILEKIPPLIGGLLRKSTTWELIDFLPFLGQLIHKFKVRSRIDQTDNVAGHTKFLG